MLSRAVFASVALRHLYTSENMGMENHSDYLFSIYIPGNLQLHSLNPSLDTTAYNT